MNRSLRFFAGAATLSILCLPLASSAHALNTSVSAQGRMNGIVKNITKSFINPSGKPFPGKSLKNVLARGQVTTGTVTAINGTTLTLSGQHKNATTTTSYAVNASAATFPFGALSNVQVGDKLFVVGTVSGTSITARLILDQSFHGRILFSGAVTAENGLTFTLNSKNNVTYTVNASQATTTKKMNTTGTAYNADSVAVGDQVIVTGTLSGSTVNATTVRNLGDKMLKHAPHQKNSHRGR